MMRSRCTLAGFVAVLAFFPAAAEPVDLLEDPAGDQIVQAGPLQQMVPDAVHHVDLAGLAILEDAEGFSFEVRFHEVPFLIQYNELDVHLNHGEQTYRIDLSADTPSGASLHRIDPLTGQSSMVGPVDADLSDTHVKRVTVPRDMLLDVEGTPPFPGRVLEGFWTQAGSWRLSVNDDDLGVWDRMPDEGSDGSYEVQQGLQHTGDARLWSPSPARASNGAANTFVFPVVASHEGESAATYDLRIEQQPDGWDVRIPSDTFRLEAGQQFRFPLMATLPSAHIHDSRESIRLSMQEVGGTSEAALDLTVVFHSIPQPAGHHPTLYLHSRAGSSASGAVLPDPGVFLYMNALPDDPDDEEVAVHGTASEVGTTAYSWSIPLHPSLQMGLDFDVQRDGTLTLPLAADAPVQDARLAADLVWRQGSEEAVLARVGPSDVFDLGPAVGERSILLEWTPEADLVPYQGLASLSLEVRLETDRPVTFTAPEAPRILPGGSLDLPLFEYEDPIDPVFLESPEVELAVVGAAQKRVNPGRTTTFDLELRTQPGASDTYRIDVTGLNADWATWPASIEVTPGESHAFQVAVQASREAHAGETADLVVAAVPAGIGDTVLARLQAVVEGGSEIPDESVDAVPDSDKSSPALAPLAALLVVAWVAGRRRAT